MCMSINLSVLNNNKRIIPSYRDVALIQICGVDYEAAHPIIVDLLLPTLIDLK